MAQPSTAADAIVRAARRAIAEGGKERLTLSAVASAAGVSRPTLYRWFASKSDLLSAISAYEQNQFDAGLQSAVAHIQSPQRRLAAALRYLVTYLDEANISSAISADPAFALQSLGESVQPYAASLARLLDDALLEIPAVRSRAMSKTQAAELLLRLAYSHFLFPHADTDVLLSNICDFAQISRRAVRLVAG